jgi:hypothetical protein
MEQKQCSGPCKETKPVTEFNVKDRRKDGSIRYQTFCRECNKAYNREHYKRHKGKYIQDASVRKKQMQQRILTFLLDYTKEGCVECGEKDFRCLEFDHRNRETKQFAISKALSECYSIQRIQEELLKCDVVCANCHKKRTADQFGWYTTYSADL